MSDRWYEKAVVYCLDIDTYADSERRRRRRHPGPDRPAGLPGPARRHLPVAQPDPPHAGPRRRLRRRRTSTTSTRASAPSATSPSCCTRRGNRGIKVIIDLVVNHTSDQHPWFQSARSSPDSPYRDWYVWSESAPPDRHQGMVFPGEQDETWSYDRTAKLWYYHRFYKFQPDLNIKNPRGPRRDQEDLRVLAAARRLRVPDGRGAVHHRADRAGQPELAQGPRVPHRAAPARAVAARATRCCWPRPTSSPTSSSTSSATAAARPTGSTCCSTSCSTAG